MKNYLLVFSLIVTVIFLTSCSKSTKTNETTTTPPKTTTTETKTVDTTKKTTQTSSGDKVKILKAKYVEYSLGDASHYVFEDESGKKWDFGGNDSDMEFEMELSKKETNSTNQGWGSNKDLQGVWFDIKYELRKQPLYEGGPVEDVPVLIEAIQVVK